LDAATWTRVLGLVGLGVRSRRAVVGVEQVRGAAMSGKLKVAIVAGDASRHSREKVLPLLKARGIRVIDGASSDALGQMVGRDATAAIGIVDQPLANGILGVVDAKA
jgi:ribosomal protein L7Ae-like RNA K-turn-binding protein